MTDFFPFKKLHIAWVGFSITTPLFLNDSWHDINLSQPMGWVDVSLRFRTLPMVTGALGAFVVAWKVAHEALGSVCGGSCGPRNFQSWKKKQIGEIPSFWRCVVTFFFGGGEMCVPSFSGGLQCHRDVWSNVSWPSVFCRWKRLFPSWRRNTEWSWFL